MSNIVTGKIRINDEIEIVELNNKPYDSNSGFYFKRSNEIISKLKERIAYLPRITFVNVSTFNNGECALYYSGEDVYFTIFNIENSLESVYQKKGLALIYEIKEDKFIFESEEVKQYFSMKYPHQYEIVHAIREEIESLRCNKVNEIYLKKSIIDNEKRNHIIEIKGNYESKLVINLKLYDITKEEELIRKSFQAEKLQALGNMSGEIAHELNNQLMAIDGNIELAMKELKSSNNIYLNNALNASYNSSKLIRNLLSFSNQETSDFEELVLDSLLDELDMQTKLLSTKSFQFIKNIDVNPSKIHINGNVKLLTQAIINIINNSIESFDKNDNVLIMNVKINYLNSCPDDAVNPIEHVSGKYLKIDIIDNGSGIPYENVKRVFDPFFSTKERLQNTGLGLTQALGTVIKHNGILALTSNQILGTTVSIYLPCKEDNKQLSFDFEVSKAKILVIDDDDTVRLVLEGLLKEMKYDVVAVSDGYEAIAFYENHYCEIDLVLCDMLMPKMNGKELFYKLKNINSMMKFILLSGYTKDNLDSNFLSQINAYLEKPIRRKILEMEIKKTLK